MVRQRVHISTVNRPSTSLNGPVEVPQNEQCGPTPHLSYSNTGSEMAHSGLLWGMTGPSSDAERRAAGSVCPICRDDDAA
jgi:hypothetical protein